MSSTPETLTLPLTHKPHWRHDCSLVNTFFFSPATHIVAMHVCVYAGMYSCLQLLDPYDGSSEDSDESDLNAPSFRVRLGKSAGGGSCRSLSRNRSFLLPKSGSRDPHPASEQQLLDVQMALESESELWLCEINVMPCGCGNLDLEESTLRAQTMDVELLEDSGVHIPPPSTGQPGNSPQVPDSSSERSPSPCHLRCLHKRKMCFPEAEVSELGQRKRQCVPSMEDEHEEGGSASEPGLNQATTD